MVRAQTDTQAEPSGGMEGELDRPENLGQKIHILYCTERRNKTVCYIGTIYTAELSIL